MKDPISSRGPLYHAFVAGPIIGRCYHQVLGRPGTCSLSPTAFVHFSPALTRPQDGAPIRPHPPSYPPPRNPFTLSDLDFLRKIERGEMPPW